MSTEACSLCGREDDRGRHHLGCARIENPGLSDKVAREKGLLAPEPEEKKAPKLKEEVLKPGSMTTVPVEDEDDEKRTCAQDGCDNEVTGDKRVKYCEDHKDPKNRKE